MMAILWKSMYITVEPVANKTINVLTINITKPNCYFYISELFSKGMTGHWDDNSYVLCQIESNESYIDCSKLYLSNWVY